jgi:uncharacterized protein YpmS
MKTQTTVLIVITIIVMQCKKQNTTTLSADKKPTVSLVSTTARLLDTVWSAPKRYMHFMITFDVVAGDSDIELNNLFKSGIMPLFYDILLLYVTHR